MAGLEGKYNNNTGILANTKERTKSDATKGYFAIDFSGSEMDNSRVNYVEVDVNEITPRPINMYSQKRIERLAKSIRSTNNRLIHPIVLVRPEDLPENSKLLQKIKSDGIKLEKPYIIVAGERRFRAWLFNREQQAKKFPDRVNPFDTITANILTASEAKNEEIYYTDSNTESRQLTPVEAMLNIRDILDTIKTNEDKRDALIAMNNSSTEGIDNDPDVAAKKFNTLEYTMYYLEDELGITGWARGTVKGFLAVVNNCDEQIINAIIDGTFTENQSRRLTGFNSEQQIQLLNLWKNGFREEYEVLIKEFELEKINSSRTKRITHRDAKRQLESFKKTVKKERDKLNEIRAGINAADKEELKKIIKKVDDFSEDINTWIKKFK